jgi:mono/diheme cytochrome c family protein
LGLEAANGILKYLNGLRGKNLLTRWGGVRNLPRIMKRVLQALVVPWLAFGISFLAPAQAVGALPEPVSAAVDFKREVEPLLTRNCITCHGPEKQRGGLRLDIKTLALAGGDSGKVLLPGKSAESLLIQLVAGIDPEKIMPPKGDRLASEEIALLRAWIDQGAEWPDDHGTIAPAVRSDHWSFQPAQRPEIPSAQNQSWVRNPIDAFVLARLERESISPAPEADRRTLIRRLSFDLVGLPPKPEEVEAFLQDNRPDAYERLVDRLLSSPHYGERWGRHWLDLARYADSDGYEKDSVRPFAWRYRDWVIEALNRDLPFDQFTIEQLAGDLLPDATLDQKIATGLHRNTLTNKEGGVDQEEFRCKAVVDRVSTTGTIWLGLTLGCAECHSHKYDPITQREFFQLYAFFNNASEKDIPAPSASELSTYQAEKEKWEETLAALQANATPEEIEEHKAKQPKLPDAKVMVLIEDEKPRTTRIHLRGDFLQPGDQVQPGTPAVLHPFQPASERPNRLDLARWITDPANPLTSRVTVNRLWARLFGRGLTATDDDFGTRGEAPSHPELLDWLATEFPRLGWSQKEMIKLMVSSATYRQSSWARSELAERDPLNVLLARQSRLRLEAETVRDTHLFAAGLFNPLIGGPSIRPPLPADIAALGYANSVKWKESGGSDKYRRGLYIFFQRTVPYPMLAAFDAPDSNASCTRRERSNTPLQALTLLNDPVFFECAQALGTRLSASPSGSLEERLRRAFEICLSREPEPIELQRLRKMYDEQFELIARHPSNASKITGDYQADPGSLIERATLIAVSRIIMNLDEFITRE